MEKLPLSRFLGHFHGFYRNTGKTVKNIKKLWLNLNIAVRILNDIVDTM